MFVLYCKSLCVCVCVCVMNSTLCATHIYLHHHILGLTSQVGTNIIVKREWMYCKSIHWLCVFVHPCVEKLSMKFCPLEHVFMYEKISFPHMPKPLAQVSASQMLIQKGFFSGLCTILASLRLCEPDHDLSVTCSGRAAYWDLLSISSLGWFI